MKKMTVVCGTCAGIGATDNFVTIEENEGVTHTARIERTICPTCKGNGRYEYALFTIEEAEAILKHCGLTTES